MRRDPVRVAEIEEQIGVAGIERGGFAEQLRGLGTRPGTAQLHDAHVVGRRGVGLDAMQRPETGHRLGMTSELEFGHGFEKRGAAAVRTVGSNGVHRGAGPLVLTLIGVHLP